MATIRCSGCSNLVAFRGRTATCPNCGTALSLHTLGSVLDIGENADPNIGPPQPTLVAEYGRTRSATVYGQNAGMSPAVKLMIGGFAALLLIGLMLSGVWWWLSRPSPAPVAVGPGPAPTPTPAPTPAPVAPTPKPAPAPTRPATQAAPTPPPPPVVTALRPELPRNNPKALTNAQIDAAIRKSVDLILSKFDGPMLSQRGAEGTSPEMVGGLHALSVYALLAAGKEIQDPRLDPRTPAMRAMIEKMKAADYSGHYEIYCRSLRLQALSVINRPEDRSMMESELRWILRAGVDGAYSYVPVKTGQRKDQIDWDNSNTQYGLLGVWASSMAGLETPANFWLAVERHFLSAQDLRSGGWDYKMPGNATPSMTAAGVNALLVASDQLINDRTLKGRDPEAVRTAIQRGLDYLGTPESIANFRSNHYGYTAYGIERVGLASGFKFFGKVDWFKTMAGMMLEDQRPDGSFPVQNVAFSDTAFCTLFLVRGRPPVMMAKLKYDGQWHRYPRDLANLSLFGTTKTERALNWQIVDVKSGWREWLDAPVLMISGTGPVPLTDEQIEDLRQYYLNGGLIFTHADQGSQAFTEWVEGLAAKIVPNGRLDSLGPDHPVYTMMLRPTPAPQLMGVKGPNRYAIIHAPTDLSIRWLRRTSSGTSQNLETGLNVFVYAAGKSLTRTRLDSPVLPPPAEPPVGTMQLARIQYGTDGKTEGANWDPEPAAWPRAGLELELGTRIHVDVKPMDVGHLSNDIRVASLTGIGPVPLTDDEVKAIRNWVAAGGVLIADACGGTKAAAEGMSAAVTRILGDAKGAPLAATEAVLTGAGYGVFGADVAKVSVSDYTIAERGGRLPAPRVARIGKGYVIFSELDLTTALLDTDVWGIMGYTGRWSRGFVRNVLLSVACETPMTTGPLGNPPAPANPAGAGK